MKDGPKISVIIASYNRKEFLLDAIKSALNQTLSKDKYEIIVVKNYNDDEIDEFINKNDIISIFSDNKSLSLKLYEALKIAKGDVISFLDDDDLFFNNKLEYVYNLFNNKALVYYHNKFIMINKNGDIIKRKAKAPDYNMSSISIKKDVINMDYLRIIKRAVDTFMYLCALESGKKIIVNKMELTHYRYHSSASNTISINKEEFNYNKIKKIDILMDSLYIFRNLFKSKKSISYIKWSITNYEIVKCPYDNSIKVENLINYILHFHDGIRHNIMFIGIYILILIYPGFFSVYIQRKIFEIQ